MGRFGLTSSKCLAMVALAPCKRAAAVRFVQSPAVFAGFVTVIAGR